MHESISHRGSPTLRHASIAAYARNSGFGEVRGTSRREIKHRRSAVQLLHTTPTHSPKGYVQAICHFLVKKAVSRTFRPKEVKDVSECLDMPIPNVNILHASVRCCYGESRYWEPPAPTFYIREMDSSYKSWYPKANAPDFCPISYWPAQFSQKQDHGNCGWNTSCRKRIPQGRCGRVQSRIQRRNREVLRIHWLQVPAQGLHELASASPSGLSRTRVENCANKPSSLSPVIRSFLSYMSHCCLSAYKAVVTYQKS